MPSRFAVCLVAVGLFGCAGGPGTPTPVTTHRLNVLLITIDTLRADRLGRGFTPTLDRLAAGGLMFTQARTPVPLTLPAHATILSGLLPHRHGVRENGGSAFSGHATLATILEQQGYATGAAVGAFVLARQFGLDAGFDCYDDGVPRRPDASTELEAQRTATAVTGAAISALAAVAPGTGAEAPRHFFLWVHYYDPHAPYTPPAEYRALAGGHDYDGEISYVDAEVRRLLVELRSYLFAGRTETLVVVAGDHGESLGEHGENTHGMLLHDGALRVPLIFAVLRSDEAASRSGREPPVDVLAAIDGPAGSRGRRSEPVSLADVAPTVLAAVGIEAPRGLDGLNVLKLPSPGREIYAETQYPRVAGWNPLTALIAEGRKLVRGGRTQLFDLTSDPAESRNIAPERAALAAAMETRLRTISATATPVKNTLTAETRERLRALGYVAASPAARAPEGAPDPADRIADWNAFEQVSIDLDTPRRAAAVVRLRRLAASNPNAQAFHTTLARVLAEDGRWRDALHAYRAAAARWSGDAVLMHDLAVAAREAGEADEAMRAEQAALALRPDDPEALNGIGLLHADAGRYADAAAVFERAVRIQNDPSYNSNLGNARHAIGNIEGARSAYRAALAFDGTWPDAANGLASLLVQEGKSTDAIPLLEKALARNPDFVEARLNLGIACHEVGRLECARASYRAVLQAGGGYPQEKAAARQLLQQVDRGVSGARR